MNIGDILICKKNCDTLVGYSSNIGEKCSIYNIKEFVNGPKIYVIEFHKPNHYYSFAESNVNKYFETLHEHRTRIIDSL